MPVESAADRLVFLNDDEFGVIITYEGNPINAIWLTESDDFAPGETEITSSRPVALVRTADVPNLDVGSHPKALKPLTYFGEIWYITSWLHDGTGMTTLRLERNVV